MLGALLLMASSILATGQPTPQQPADYTPAAQSRVVSWQLKRIPPPSPLYVGVDDKLVVGAATSQSNEVVTVNYRLLRASDGVIVPGQFIVSPPNTRAVTVQQQQLAEGFLLSVSVKATVAITRGMTFVRAFLGAGPFGAGQPSYMLMADYVTTAMAPAHPNGRVLAPTEGPGNITTFKTVQPPVGTDWSFGPPTNARWRLQSVYIDFVASAQVATREMFFAVNNSVSSRCYRVDAQTGITANTLPGFELGSGLPFVSPASLVIQLPIPTPYYLLGSQGDVLSVLTTQLQTLDQWRPVLFSVEEWLDNV